MMKLGFIGTGNMAGATMVRNDSEGTVTMEVQGREALINKLLVGLNSGRFISIEWVDTKEIPLEEERGFTVKM